jgi:hypothetical protein
MRLLAIPEDIYAVQYVLSLKGGSEVRYSLARYTGSKWEFTDSVEGYSLDSPSVKITKYSRIKEWVNV